MKMQTIESALRKNGAAILSGIAAVGVIGTAITAAKAGPKAMDILRKDDTGEERFSEDLSAVDKIRLTWKCYLPVAAFTAGTIFCIASAGVLNAKMQASLAGTCLMLNQSFKNYRKKVDEIYGEDADLQVRNEISKESRTKLTLDDLKQKIWFYDSFSDRWFESTIEDVQAAEYHFNRNFILRGYATVNEFYEFLGLDPMPGDIDLGWSCDAGFAYYGYAWVDFVHTQVVKDDGTEYIEISMPFVPTEDYNGDYLEYDMVMQMPEDSDNYTLR